MRCARRASSYSERLSYLFSRLKDWISVAEFEAAVNQYFTEERSAAELAAYRARRSPLKKLRDEVIPVLNFLKFTNAQGHVRFELDNGYPDCWLRENISSEPRGVEVTVAQAREQQLLGEELNEKGIGRGFLGLPDDASSRAFSAKLAHPRVMYSTEAALSVVNDGIKRCLQKKNKPKYVGQTLLVEAPLRILPNERWSAIQEDLRLTAIPMPFEAIYVIGNQADEPFGFRIK